MDSFEFKALPFGPVNAPTIFHTLINKIFAQQIGKHVKVYLADILVCSKALEDQSDISKRCSRF